MTFLAFRQRSEHARAMTQALESFRQSMFPRRSITFPLALGIAMICLLIVVIVGWILVTIRGALQENGSPVYWVWLIVGTVILCSILAGLAFYLSFLINSVRINLRQANFIDAVTHELKSPIASLRLGLETIARRKLSPEELERFVRAMKKDIFRLDRLVSHLLDAAGLNVGDQPVREPCDWRQIVADCAAEVCAYRDFPVADIEWEVESFEHCGPIQDYEIIVRNLIDNAVKYCGDPPQIRITVSSRETARGEQRLILKVENNGSSVPDSEKKRVFDRFERTEFELERTKPGVGLGLYIVQLLVKRNQGRIRLETPESGEGTRVIVEVPLESAGSTTADASRSPENKTLSNDVHSNGLPYSSRPGFNRSPAEAAPAAAELGIAVSEEMPARRGEH